MNINSIPAAVAYLRDALREGTKPSEAVSETCAEFDVTERALRVRFERQFEATPEAYANRRFAVVDPGLVARQFAESYGLHPTMMQHAGKRFVLEVVDDDSGDVWRRTLRFIRFCGKFVEVLDEETNERSEIWDRELMDQVARKTGWRYRI